MRVYLAKPAYFLGRGVSQTFLGLKSLCFGYMGPLTKFHYNTISLSESFRFFKKKFEDQPTDRPTDLGIDASSRSIKIMWSFSHEISDKGLFTNLETLRGGGGE